MKKSVISAGASSEISGASRWLAARAGEAGTTDRTDRPRIAPLRVRDKTVMKQGFRGSTVASLLGARRVAPRICPDTGVAASWMRLRKLFRLDAGVPHQ